MPNTCDHYLDCLEEGGDDGDICLGGTPEHRVCGLGGVHGGFQEVLESP